ncbi:hypothetical protein [Dyella mobilis]|uniref:Uncharacterized protein n=1 Tax=Dyella mobilis TaxID=1849582 RepID=A0ABS2KET9_9GAMM|nr:hypothetical protein [Dyella mobilis]MBM7129681.1 hypothetical protein [Dyella mobilis]GLQ98053.1 hypothetical protein GCM10007863_24730 [Dyella mobilis]
MVNRTLSQIRSDLATMTTGANRRLLYPASGDDVGCSVGLFWSICDSFYLIDPYFGKGIDVKGALKAMAEGSANYMTGMRVASDGGTRLKFDGVPGTEYQVWLESQPSIKKRLCFIDSNTDTWLEKTTTRYNVILNKDYDGITGNDNYPYVTAWDRLNSNGIFAETIGDGRDSGEFDFIRYRCRGFEPLCKATTEAGGQIGFASGLHLFQKRSHYHTTEYDNFDRSIETVIGAVNEIMGDFMGDTALVTDVSREGATAGVRQRAAELLVVFNGTTTKNWASVEKNPAFVDWLYRCLRRDHPAAINAIDRLNSTKGVGFTRSFLQAALKPLRLFSWGPI